MAYPATSGREEEHRARCLVNWGEDPPQTTTFSFSKHHLGSFFYIVAGLLFDRRRGGGVDVRLGVA